MSQQRSICQADANGNGILGATHGTGKGGKLREGGAKVWKKKPLDGYVSTWGNSSATGEAGHVVKALSAA